MINATQFSILTSKYNLANEFSDSVRDKLKKELSLCHPDKTNGNFVDDEHKEKFHELQEAIEYLEANKGNQQLIPVSTVTELVKAFTQLMPNNSVSPLQSLDSVLKENIRDVIEHQSVGFVFPRISLAFLSLVFTLILAFPKQVIEHPIFKNWLDPTSVNFLLIWSMTLFCTGIIWLFAYSFQARNKKVLSSIKLASFQNNLYNGFLGEHSEATFSKSDLTNYLENVLIYRPRVRQRGIIAMPMSIFYRFFDNDLLTPEVIESAANVLLDKAMRNKAILKMETGTFDEEYVIARNPLAKGTENFQTSND
jgi:hypothetical protein